ncbi:MAG: hypothetical protein D8M58_18485 [Calditrichaeota bacterium]|nr:MAG: hypothetical protein DWQ03_11715 [Calditrichota bacterium]MBL1207398.1 hypothetical protein [Calditrichota bacterium]NOG47230.1 hypothetical protein [Calditrichota bacterium]
MRIINSPGDAHSKPPPNTDMYTRYSPYLRILAFGVALGVSSVVLFLLLQLPLFDFESETSIVQTCCGEISIGNFQLSSLNVGLVLIKGFFAGIAISFIYNSFLYFGDNTF